MNDSQSLPRGWMFLIALGQGVALLLLYKAVDLDRWPSSSPAWSYPLWTLAFAVPTLLLLSLERGSIGRVVKLVAAFSLLLAVTALYIGSQARPFDAFPLTNLTIVFTITTAIASFKALMYLQQRASRMPMSYDVLFINSWRNFLTLGLALIFTLVFWMILRLWSGLFLVIGIEFFRELFTTDWFLIPLLALAHCVGILVFRNLTRVIDSITRLLQGLIKLLLPLVLAIAVAFVLSLPFAGLEALWSTGYGTSMLLALLALILFFVNAVYQDGRGERPYPQAVHRVLYVCLFVTPAISALGLYGLVLRIQQYGWSVGRCWAFTVWLLLTLFAVGYVVGVLRKRDEWTADLARVNTAMGLVVLAVLLLANTPVLDFRKISLASQVARVESGEVELRDFDFAYAHRVLARPGHLALQEMKEQVAASDPDLAERIENPGYAGIRRQQAPDVWWSRVVYRPEPFEVPADLRRQIADEHSLYAGADPVLIRIDLDEDGRDEYALIVLYRADASGTYGYSSATVYFRQGDQWVAATASLWDEAQNAAGIKSGDLALEQPRFGNLRIGDAVLEAWDMGSRPAPVAEPGTGVD